jgi:hypothetical protein
MKKMNKEQVIGLVRQILTFVSVFLITKGIIPQTLANEIITGVIILAMVVWSWVDKSNRNLSVWMVFVRQALTIVGAFIMGKGLIKAEIWNEVIAMVMTLTSIVLSYIGNGAIITEPVVELPKKDEEVKQF